MDSLLNICEIHFPHYTSEEISTYIRSLHQNTLQTIIQGIYDYSQIKNTICYLRLELGKFHQTYNLNLNEGRNLPIKYINADYLAAAFKIWKKSNKNEPPVIKQQNFILNPSIVQPILASSILTSAINRPTNSTSQAKSLEASITFSPSNPKLSQLSALATEFKPKLQNLSGKVESIKFHISKTSSI